MKLKNIDLFKGLLIVLVIIGHILQGKMDESIWRTIIYSFHMPLFIGICGFLFNANKVVEIKLIQILRKYLFRVIIPWIIAVIFYFSLSLIQNNSSNILIGFIKAFVFPFYHLWFILGFLSWIILTWLLKKIITGDKILLSIGFLISVVSILLTEYPEIYQDCKLIGPTIKSVLHTFRPYYYFFFVLGLIYRNINLKEPKIMEYIFPSIFFILVIFLFYNPDKILSIFNFFIFNTLLLSLILKIASNNLILENRIIEWIGLNSLAIYLWHVIPIMICKVLIGIENLVFFYSATICLELIFIFTYNYLLRIELLKKYVFGM